jgi:hypothetical protein
VAELKIVVPINWPDWIKSDEGKRCADPKTLRLDYRQGEFLENRLWAAFVAGAKYERDKDCADKKKMLEGFKGMTERDFEG